MMKSLLIDLSILLVYFIYSFLFLRSIKKISHSWNTILIPRLIDLLNDLFKFFIWREKNKRETKRFKNWYRGKSSIFHTFISSNQVFVKLSFMTKNCICFTFHFFEAFWRKNAITSVLVSVRRKCVPKMFFFKFQ